MALPVQTNASLTLNHPLEPQLRSKLLRQMEAGGNLHLLQYPLPPLRTTLEDGGNLHLLRCPLPPLRTMQEDGVNHPLLILPKPILLNRIRSIPTWPQNPSLSNRKKAHTYHGKAVLCKFTCNCQRWTRMLIQGTSYSQPTPMLEPVEPLPPLAFRSRRNKRSSKNASKAKSATSGDEERSVSGTDPGGWGEPASGGWGEPASASAPSETGSTPAGIHPSRLRMLGGGPVVDPVPSAPSRDYSQPSSRRVTGANASVGGDNGWGNRRRTPSATADSDTLSPAAASFTYPQPDARPAPPSGSAPAGGAAGIHPDRLRMLGGAPAASSPPMGFGGSREPPPHMRGGMNEFGAVAGGKPKNSGWGSRGKRGPPAQAPVSNDGGNSGWGQTANASGGGWGNDASNGGAPGGW